LKPVIIIAIAFVLLIPIPIFAETGDVDLDGHVSKAGDFPWRVLTVSDFKADIPEEAQTGAISSTNLDWKVDYKYTNDMPCEYTIFSIDVITIFKTSTSWFKKYSPEYTVKLLKHEQTHFDIRETYTRDIEKKLNDEFSGKSYQCTNLKTPDIKKLVLQSRDEASAISKRYDAEVYQISDGSTTIDYKKQADYDEKAACMLLYGLTQTCLDKEATEVPEIYSISNEIPIHIFTEIIPEPIPEPTPELIPELAEPKSPQESEKSSNDEPIIISDEEKSDNNQIIWVFVIISFIIMGFVILKKNLSKQEDAIPKLKKYLEDKK